MIGYSSKDDVTRTRTRHFGRHGQDAEPGDGGQEGGEGRPEAGQRVRLSMITY